MKKERLSKIFFDWMGVLLAISLVVLGATGAWAPGKASSEQAVAGRLPLEMTAATDETTLSESLIEAPEDALESSSALEFRQNSEAPLIIVDAGHGLPDNGASSANGVPEAPLNLAVAQLVESGLREAGFRVEMTRTSENAIGKDKRKDMDARRTIMRHEDVAAIVSIHMNKFRDTGIHGPMAFYMKGSTEGERLASVVITQVCAAINHPKRDANPGDYFVLRESIAPAVIVECGFLSNPQDEALLQDVTHQKKLAAGIVAGVASYFRPDE